MNADQPSRQGGGSNSRPTAASGSDTWSAAPPGIDTLMLRWRPDASAYESFRDTGNVAVMAGGRLQRTLPELPGVQVGVYPDGLVTAEARLAVMLDGPTSHELVTSLHLRDAVDRLRPHLERAVLSELDDAAVGRIDVAGELRFADGADGAALIAAGAVVDVPRCETTVYGLKGSRISGVTYRRLNGRSVLGRLYDKGLEAGTHERGERVRFERQMRARKSREQTVDVVAAEQVEGRLIELLAPFADAGTVVVSPTAIAAVQVLQHRVSRGEMAWTQAARLTWFVMAGADARSLMSERAYYRAAGELRRAGVTVGQLGVDAVEVPLGAYALALAA